MNKKMIIMAAFSVSVSAAIAHASEGSDKTELLRPKLFKEVLGCQSITDSEKRLKCYDESVRALNDAVKTDEVIITDKAAVNEAKRGLFGFSLPDIKIFDNGTNEISEIEEVISTVDYASNGSLRITLESGAIWQQTDNLPVLGNPKSGTTVRIRKAAMGSFLVNIGKARAIRMKRVN